MNYTEQKKNTVDRDKSIMLAECAYPRPELTGVNSYLDSELLVPGAIITGAYIEGGIRDFDDYAVLMIDDVGSNIKPYLLSFWEGIRDHPLFETEGMTSVKDSRDLYEQLLSEHCDINDRL